MTKLKTNKFISLLVATALCLAFFPLTTAAATTTDSIIVNNIDIVTAPNYTVQCGSGVAVYDPQEKTLTLNQAEITVGAQASSSTGERYGIAVKAPSITTLEIILNGNNSINLPDTQYKNMGIWSTKSALNFSGGGSLNISLYNNYWPHAIHAQGYDIEFDSVDIVCNQLNDEHKGYAILSTKTVTATNTSFEINGFETAIDAGKLVMKDSSLKAANSADWGIAVFTNEMLIENSTVDTRVVDTGLYCWGNMTVNDSTINCLDARVGLYADTGNMVITDSALNLPSKTYGLRIYNGKLTVNDSSVNAVGKESRGGISVLNEKGSNTEPPADAITLSDNLAEMNNGKIATVEVMWDNGYDEPYPVYITTYIPKGDSTLATDLSNVLVTVNIGFKEADYTAVDKAIAAANALDKKLYKDFSTIEKAINAVVRNKNITEQPLVDVMAKNINDAIATAIKKEIATITDIADLSKTYDSKAITITENQYKYNGDGKITITWYADNNGVKGDKIDAPTNVGTYWVGISADMSDNYLAAEEVYKSFTINEKIISPITSDCSNIYLWITLLVVSGFMLIITTAHIKKLRYNN